MPKRIPSLVGRGTLPLVLLAFMASAHTGCGSTATSGGSRGSGDYERTIAGLRRSDPAFASPQEIPGQRITPMDLERVVRVMNTACHAGTARACGEAAWWFAFGPEVVRRPGAAQRARALGIREGDPLSMFLEGESRNPQDLDLVRGACLGGLAYACSHIALVSPHSAETLQFAKRGCEIGDASGCGLFAFLGRGQGETDSVARRLAQRGCDGADFLSCVMEANFGQPRSSDHATAAQWERIVRTSVTPRGRIPLFEGRAGQRYRVPRNGHLYAKRQTSSAHPITLVHFGLALSSTLTLRVRHLVRSTTPAARLSIQSSRRLPSDCNFVVQRRNERLRYHTRGHAAHNVFFHRSTRIQLDHLWEIADGSATLEICGETVRSPLLRRYLSMLAISHETLFRPDDDGLEPWQHGIYTNRPPANR